MEQNNYENIYSTTADKTSPYQTKSNGTAKAAWVISIICMIVNTIFVLGMSGFVAVLSNEAMLTTTVEVSSYIMLICCLLPLAWQIPMTVMMKKYADGKTSKSVALGICTLLFCNLISGILLLVSEE